MTAATLLRKVPETIRGLVIKNIFVEGPLLGGRLLILGMLSIALAWVDVRYDFLDPAREQVSNLLSPVVWLADSPKRLGDWASESAASKGDLLEENAALKTRLLILEADAMKAASLAAEVNRLRELLNASAIVDDSVLVAEIIGVNPDPYLHEVVINKGNSVGVYPGQPVLDSSGLMGQVTHVEERRSRALLITDNNHAVPVQVLRNGVRGVLVGTGQLDELLLVNMPDTADVRAGDQLVSSGLGGRFPSGYPVAEVLSVEHDPGETFASIRARPLAELNKSRHVLLVFRGATTTWQSNRANPEPES